MTSTRDMLSAARAAIARTAELEKKGFVPMPGGGAEPVAGASAMTAGLASPMAGDQAAAGMPPVDPATGMPMDPAAMAGGMPPVDPATGMPIDPAMMGGMPPPAAPAPAPVPEAGAPVPTNDGMITMPVSQLIELLTTLGANGAKKPTGASGKPASTAPDQGGQLNEIYQAMVNAGLIQAKTAAHPLAGTAIGGGLGAAFGSGMATQYGIETAALRDSKVLRSLAPQLEPEMRMARNGKILGPAIAGLLAGLGVDGVRALITSAQQKRDDEETKTAAHPLAGTVSGLGLGLAGGLGRSAYQVATEPSLKDLVALNKAAPGLLARSVGYNVGHNATLGAGIGLGAGVSVDLLRALARAFKSEDDPAEQPEPGAE